MSDKMLMRFRGSRDSGFTLIELLIVIAVLPLVIGAITLGFVTTLDNRASAASRISDSHDSQITATYLSRDVQRSQHLTTSSTPICGSDPQVLGLSWTQLVSGGTAITEDATYAVSTSKHTLVRNFCKNGSTSTSTLAHGVFASVPSAGACPSTGFGNGATTCGLAANGVADVAVTVTCPASCRSGVVPTTPQPNATPTQPGVSTVRIDVQEVGSQLIGQSAFTFHVTGSPRDTTASGLGPNNTPPGGAPPLELINGGGVTADGGCQMNVNGTAAINSTNPQLPAGNFNATEIYSQSSSPYSGSPSPAPPYVSGPVLSDPYSGLAPPGPDTTNLPIHTSIPGGSNVTLDGVYILANGYSLNPGNKTITTGPDGVLIYLTGGSLGLRGNGGTTLSPTSDYLPVVIWVDQSDTGASVYLGGTGGATSITGTIYAPTATVETQGNASIAAGGIVAENLHCGGTKSTIGAGPTDATSTALDVSPASPSTSGQPVTLTATISDTTSPGTNVTTGNVAFQVTDANGNTTADCATPVAINNSGVATCVTGNLSTSQQPYTITATYQGDGVTFGASLPATAFQKVFTATATQLTTAAPSTIQSGTQVVYTATVSANTGSTTPSGPVVFSFAQGGGPGLTCIEGTNNSVTLDNNGKATCTVTLFASQTQVSATASYAQNSPFFGSTSAPAIVKTVTQISTSTAVVSSKAVSRPSNAVNFTATVSSSPSGTIVNAVNWSIKSSGGANVNCVGTTPPSTTLVGGIATCQIPANTFTVAGSQYTIQATYVGDANHATSLSLPILQTVTTSPPQIPSSTKASEALATTGGKRPVDTAVVTGTDGFHPQVTVPAETVTFYLCNVTPGNGCTSQTNQVGTGALDATGTASYKLTGNQLSALPSGSGTWCFAASFGGDSDYQPSSDTTPDQCFTV